MVKSFSPDQFRAVLRAKGWSNKALATYWGMSVVHISRLIGNEERPIYWNDAVFGLPRFGRLSADLVARKGKVDALLVKSPLPKKPGPRPRAVQYDPAEEVTAPVEAFGGDYRYKGYLTVGAIVVATQDIGDMAEEGGRGIVFAVEDVKIGEKYGVIFEGGGFDWFLAHHIDVCLASIGLDSPSTDYVYRSDHTLKSDFDAGVFEFW